jgi:hypothetical protein
MAAVQNPIVEITAAVLALPPDAQREVLHFAQYLRTRLVDDAWDAALEDTTTEQAASIRARIAEQRAQATHLFNDAGKLSGS